MGSKILPTHALLPCLPTAAAHRPGLALSVFSSLHSLSSPCSFTSTCLSLTRASASITPAAAGRNGTLAVARAAEGDAEAAAAVEDAETVDDEASEEEVAEGSDVEEATPRKPIVKLGDIMGILHKRAIEASETERPIPDIRTGDVVEIKLEVPENRRRVSIYKGIVISKQNAGIHTTIRIRRIVAGIGVEIVFPIYSPNIKEIKVVNHRKVRRARLYYLRDKLPRFSTFN